MYFHFEDKATPISVRTFEDLSPMPHLHHHLEVGLLQKGKARVFADDREADCFAGDIFLIFPNQIHFYRHLNEENPEGILLIFSPELIPEFNECFAKEIPLIPKAEAVGTDPALTSCMEELLRLEETPDIPYKEVRIRAELLLLFSGLLPKLFLSPAVRCDTDALKAVIRYCSENYTRDISLQTLSDSLFISKYYISHLFGQRLKVSFSDYINALRVRRACELLKYGNLTITEVALAVGYNSTRSFDRCFKKFLNVSPKNYRFRKETNA